MGDLEFEGTFEEQWGTMKGAVKQMHRDLYGNGQPGAMEFIQETKGQLRLLAWLCGTIIALLAVGIALEANRQAHAGILRVGAGITVNAQTARDPYLR